MNDVDYYELIEFHGSDRARRLADEADLDAQEYEAWLGGWNQPKGKNA